MSRKIVLFFLIIALAMPAIAWAGPKHIEYEHLDSCMPQSKDGTQVREGIWYKGVCFGKPKIILRITDFVLEAMCSVQSFSCIGIAAMSPDERAYYESLKVYAVSRPDAKVCVQRNDTWRRDMITAGDVQCTPSHHGARSYDFVMRKGCVLDGDLVIGCVTLTDAQIARAKAVDTIAAE